MKDHMSEEENDIWSFFVKKEVDKILYFFYTDCIT